MSKIILTGDRPTGRLHVGHYVGSLSERVRLQNSGLYDEIYIMIAMLNTLKKFARTSFRLPWIILHAALILRNPLSLSSPWFQSLQSLLFII